MKMVFTVFVLVCIVTWIPSQVMSQEVYSEVPFVMEGGVLKCKRVIVAFNQNVIPTESGVTVVDTTRFPIRNASVRNLIRQLSRRYGPATIRKTIPRLVWGDTIVVNKRTGVRSKVPDMSQNFAIDFSTLIPIDSVIAAFQSLPVVRYAEQPISIGLLAQPNDPYYTNGYQWHLNRIKAPSAWDITTGSSSIRIAIIDIRGLLQVSAHEDFQLPGGGNKFVGGDGEIGGAHARYVAGVAGATTNNGIGVASLGWNASLLGYHFTEETESGTRLPTLIDSAVADNANVINFSITTLRNVYNRPCPANFPEVEEAVEIAFARGVVLVGAAGNASWPGCENGQVPYFHYPAAYSEVIAVSGTDQNDEFVESWNYGSFVDVSVPAMNIWTTGDLTNTYLPVAGTSFAAPQVAALAALILSISPINNTDVQSIIEQSADKVGTAYPYVDGRNDHLGYGRINAYQALLLTHAYSTKSISATATASNNGRRLVKTSDGRYHLVFESGITSDGQVLSEIFYRNHDGTNWSAPMRLSSGNEQNAYFDLHIFLDISPLNC